MTQKTMPHNTMKVTPLNSQQDDFYRIAKQVALDVKPHLNQDQWQTLKALLNSLLLLTKKANQKLDAQVAGQKNDKLFAPVFAELNLMEDFLETCLLTKD